MQRFGTGRFNTEKKQIKDDLLGNTKGRKSSSVTQKVVFMFFQDTQVGISPLWVSFPCRILAFRHFPSERPGASEPAEH
jgi:hypothetical protein